MQRDFPSCYGPAPMITTRRRVGVGVAVAGHERDLQGRCLGDEKAVERIQMVQWQSRVAHEVAGLDRNQHQHATHDVLGEELVHVQARVSWSEVKASAQPESNPPSPSRSYLLTGGAGFIGANTAHHLLARGARVRLLDNLSRPGASANLQWLRECHGHVVIDTGDIRDREAVERCVREVDVVIHLASQVAVTRSIEDPRGDFEDNALGTLNVLEAARHSPRRPIVIYASTNKVYGAMEDLPIVDGPSGYRYADLAWGVDESRPLDFHSPYGCSKGAGDQYVRDYHRIFGLRTVVLRQSCIYGPRQFGVPDQGWVAWLATAAVTGRRVSIQGNGRQARDVLHVDDLVRCYDRAVERIEQVAGEVFNIGGGPANILSVWHQLGPLLEDLIGRSVDASFGTPRPGDQLVYVSDIRRAADRLGWRPTIAARDGVERLVKWIADHRELVESLL